MQFEHTIPASWDHRWIIDQGGVVAAYNVAVGAEETTISYTGTQEQFDALEAVIDSYPTEYLAQVLRPQRWAEVKAKREERLAAGAETPFGVVQTDVVSRGYVTGLVTRALIAQVNAEAGFSRTFTTAANASVTLNASQIIALGAMVEEYVNACHERSQAFRDEIEAAEDMAALLAIDIAVGWP